jgi:hypothetical protein
MRLRSVPNLVHCRMTPIKELELAKRRLANVSAINE